MSDTTESPLESNPLIDKITLELLMNKTQYNKYISKTDPKRHSELEEYYSNINQYKSSIFQLTDELIENPEMAITNEVNEAFEYYTKTLIRYFKVKEVESANEYNKSEDDDTMFGIMDTPASENSFSKTNASASFWGGERIKKKSQTQANINAFALGFIPRKKYE